FYFRYQCYTLFFFSSRRRHTRFSRDWSSDVCSSDLVTPQRIEAEGVVSSSMGVAKGFVEDARAGFPFQTSLGAIIEEAEFVERGQRATVNGRSEKGPLLIARKTMVREISVTVLGADSGTRVSVAARGT